MDNYIIRLSNYKNYKVTIDYANNYRSYKLSI